MKILGIILAVIVGLVLLAVLGGYFWWHSNEEAIKAEIARNTEQGVSFGSTASGGECVDEVIVLSRPCNGISCQIGLRTWLESCLESAEVAPDFCEQVPPGSELLESARWGVTRCQQKGVDNQSCGAVLAQVATWCEEP